MHRSIEPIELTLYHDVLCGWSFLADERLSLLCEEFEPLLRLRLRPFAVRVEPRIPTRWECASEASALRKVGREPEGRGIVPDLWRSVDPPRSSLPPLVALQAATIVGGQRGMRRMLSELRRAALFRGINVSREDVILEVAESCGLDMHRFGNAFFSDHTRRVVLDQYEEALARGIDSVPTLIVGDEWMLSGARSVAEYRATIRRFIRQQGLRMPERIVH